MFEFDNHGLTAGIWSGALRSSQQPARVYVALNGETVAEARLTPQSDGEWLVQAGLPPDALADGTHSFLLLTDDGQPHSPPQADATRLASLSILAGEVLADDLRAQIDLLRSEIDLLKRELRRLARQS